MGMKVNVVDTKSLLLGDNEFETGVITLAAGSTIKAGVLLSRNSGKFTVVTNTASQTPIAVLVTDLTNDGASNADVSVRPCISGKVRADMLHVNGIPATDEQYDMIRDYGIIAKKTTDLSRLDNGAY